MLKLEIQPLLVNADVLAILSNPVFKTKKSTSSICQVTVSKKKNYDKMYKIVETIFLGVCEFI